jgi:hypothetical protein
LSIWANDSAATDDKDIAQKEGKHEGSSSFLKKRTKKLLLLGMRTDRTGRVNQHSKSFLVLFFKKELLPG